MRPYVENVIENKICFWKKSPQYSSINLSCPFFSWTGSYTIQGRRVQVYQPEFEKPWALGLVSQHDPVSHIMEITMDQVRVKVSTPFL